jgi:hypothetical protein
MKWVLLAATVFACSLDGERASAQAELPKELGALFQARCVRCHGDKNPKAKLNLSSADGLGWGSKSGAVVQPAKLKESLLWQVIDEQRMPPKEPLAAAERAVVRRWIEQGAPGFTAKAPTHWGFIPPRRPPIPQVTHAELVRTEIDQFIEAALEKKHLSLSPEADRLTLIRRVSFDLAGLPPTLNEVDTWLNDKEPDAYERMIEHYLASPHYGERWGKYWLDTAGYADSNGYFNADSDRPFAYRYRDYVIRSFNQDKPYDRFVTEQLAGDELAGYRPDGDVTSAMVELLTATHFLRNAPDGSGESDGNPDEVRTDRFTVLEGNVQNMVNSLLGLTIQCVRCHEHKFEPIAHDEYYRLQAILYPAYAPERWTMPKDRVVSIATAAQRAEHQRLTQRVERQVKALSESLNAIAGPLREQLIEERLPNLSAAGKAEVLAAVNTAKEKRTPAQQSLLEKHAAALKIADADLAKRFPEYAAVRDQVKKAIAEREKERPAPLEKLSVFVETDPKPLVHHVLLRGQHNAPGKEVEPGVPGSLCRPTNSYKIAERPAGQISSGRRTAFARWLTSVDNPLFARVMVNRIWQHHFGVGLVSTPDNLGQSGARPSHPELLDYLATEFVRSGYSIKQMHGLIMSSAVYRQSGALQVEASALDPDNRLLWRYPLRRLDAEAVRDALLAVAGELDPRAGGPYVPTHRSADGSVEIDEKHEGARRRSVYLQQRRTQVTTLLDLFDAPALVGNCSKRNTSTIPLQSLALLNSSFVRLRAEAFACRLEKEAQDEGRRLTLAFRLALGRPPTDAESAAASRFQEKQRAVYAKDQDAARKVWTDLCQMLLASNAFLYVE